MVVILAIGLLNVADVVVMYTHEHEANSTASWVEYSIRHEDGSANATAGASNTDVFAHLPVLMSLLAQITTSIGLVVACYFNCCCATLAHAISAFLQRVRGINGGAEMQTTTASEHILYEASDANNGRPHIVQELKKCRDHYSTIVEAVQLVNDVFEVFLAVMMLFKIPSSMFMLLKCFLGTKASLLDFAFNLSELLFSIVDLLSVTVMPARVHSLLRQVDSAVMGNMNVWLPPNKSVYEHGALLIGHIRQPDLGLSLFGFAVITKPLILRVTVAILTYLIIFVQLYPSWSTVFDDVDWYS